MMLRVLFSQLNQFSEDLKMEISKANDGEHTDEIINANDDEDSDVIYIGESSDWKSYTSVIGGAFDNEQVDKFYTALKTNIGTKNLSTATANDALHKSFQHYVVNKQIGLSKFGRLLQQRKPEIDNLNRIFKKTNHSMWSTSKTEGLLLTFHLCFITDDMYVL
jgi:hypothetical protein